MSCSSNLSNWESAYPNSFMPRVKADAADQPQPPCATAAAAHALHPCPCLRRIESLMHAWVHSVRDTRLLLANLCIVPLLPLLSQ
jgi:hypothetical protein